MIGYTIYWLNKGAYLEPFYVSILLVTTSLVKASYFMSMTYHKIIESTEKDVPYFHFLIFILMIVTLIVLSFSLDFFCMYRIDEKSFVGIILSPNVYEVFFDCVYFSTLNFSYFGFGEIMPQTIFSKILVLTELIVSFLTIILILSDFISLKESLVRVRKKGGDGSPTS